MIGADQSIHTKFQNCIICKSNYVYGFTSTCAWRAAFVTWSGGMSLMLGVLIMPYIVFELQRIAHISATRCPIGMGVGSICSILNWQVIYIKNSKLNIAEKSKLNIADIWLIFLDRELRWGVFSAAGLTAWCLASEAALSQVTFPHNVICKQVSAIPAHRSFEWRNYYQMFFLCTIIIHAQIHLTGYLVSYDAALLWLLQVGVAVRVCWGNSATAALYGVVAPVGVAAVYSHSYSNLQ